MLKAKKFKSPLGTLTLIASEKGLCHILFPDESAADYGAAMMAPKTADKVLDKTARELEEYFHGGRKNFTVPLDLHGTDFQLRAWKSLLKIPYGRTTTYKGQALSMRMQKGFRAVGAANGRNPVPIIVPCHRVIAQNGHLHGYGGGLSIKKKLLQLEGLELQGLRLQTP